MASIEELYKYYEKLTDAKDKAGSVRKFFFQFGRHMLCIFRVYALLFFFQLETEFLAIINAVKGGPQEKKLASQLIARFFKYFPQHTDKAMNAQLDLCEDDDVNVSSFSSFIQLR